MIFQKYYKDSEQGIILIDVLLALSISVLFVSLMTETTLGARDLFERAQTREKLLDAYELHANKFTDLGPHELRFATTSTREVLRATARPYGNERIETWVEVFADASSTDPLTFVSVRKKPVAEGITAGTPLCSVNFAQKATVGSYSYISEHGGALLPSEMVSKLKIVPIHLPISATLPLTDLVVRNGVAYISVDSAVMGDPDVFVLDIRSSTSPFVRSSLHTGPGISAITVAGNHIFAAVASTASQLHSIRMESLDSLVLETKYQLELPYATATPTVGSAVFYDQKKVYLGTEKWPGPEFVIMDVSRPDMPIKVGSLEIGTKVNEIYIGGPGSLSYIATAGQAQLLTVDVEDSPNPAVVDIFSPTGWQRQEGKVLSLFEEGLVFGRTSGGFNIIQDHEIFTWGSNPQTRDSAGGIYGLVSDRSYEFVAGRQLGKEFQIFDHALSATTSVAVPLPGQPQVMSCDRDSLYVLSKTSPTIYQIYFQ